MNKRAELVSEICPNCPKWGDCPLEVDCEALRILVRIYEDLRCNDTGYGDV